MSKAVEEAKERLNRFKTIKVMYGNTFVMTTEQLEQTQKDVKVVLQALDNSIPKEKAKKKMEDLKRVKERNVKRDFDTVYRDGYYSGGIDAIYELLEEK